MWYIPIHRRCHTMLPRALYSLPSTNTEIVKPAWLYFPALTRKPEHFHRPLFSHKRQCSVRTWSTRWSGYSYQTTIGLINLRRCRFHWNSSVLNVRVSHTLNQRDVTRIFSALGRGACVLCVCVCVCVCVSECVGVGVGGSAWVGMGVCRNSCERECAF